MSEPILPPVDRAALPADVRAAGPERQREYRAALGFERALLTQLTRQLAQSAEGQGGGAGPAAYRQMLPETLADALVAQGGLGLAREMDRALHPEPRAHRRTGGAPAPDAS